MLVWGYQFQVTTYSLLPKYVNAPSGNIVLLGSSQGGAYGTQRGTEEELTCIPNDFDKSISCRNQNHARLEVYSSMYKLNPWSLQLRLKADLTDMCRTDALGLIL